MTRENDFGSTMIYIITEVHNLMKKNVQCSVVIYR